MLDRFELLGNGKGPIKYAEQAVICDKETGVLYYLIRSTTSSSAPCITPLIDENGKPLVKNR